MVSDTTINAWYELVEDCVNTGKFSGSHDVYMARELVDQQLSQFKFKKTDSILVMYNIEYLISLIYTYNISPSNIVFYSDHVTKSKIADKLGVGFDEVLTKLDYKKNSLNMILLQFKEKVKTYMKFDNTISNVPYNTREESYTGDVEVAGGKMGTVGDKTIGKKLNQLQRELTKPGGNISQMGLKASMLDDVLVDSTWNPITLSLMVDKEWWRYNTFWVFGKKETNTNSYTVYGTDIDSKICAKIFAKGGFKATVQQDSYKQLIDKGMITDVDNGNPLCIVRNVKRDDKQIIRAYPTEKGLKKVIYGPKYTQYMAESAITWLATDEPMLCDCAIVWSHQSLDLAKKQKLFTEKNPLLKFMHKKLKFKGQDQFWFYTKLFDLSQIKTGLEFPNEYKLTKEEKDYIVKNFTRNEKSSKKLPG